MSGYAACMKIMLAGTKLYLLCMAGKRLCAKGLQRLRSVCIIVFSTFTAADIPRLMRVAAKGEYTVKRRFRLSLKREVFILTLLYALVFSLVFLVIIGNLLFQSNLNEMKEKLHGSNLQMVTFLNTLFTSAQSTLTYFENAADLYAEDAQEQEKTLAVFLTIDRSSMNIGSVFLGYADGTLLAADYEIPQGYDVRNAPWYIEAVRSYPEDIIALPYQDEASGSWRFCSARALADESGAIVSVLAIDFSVEKLFENVLMLTHYESQVNYVMDKNGICIYHPDKSMIGTNITDSLSGAPGMFAQDEEYIEYTLGDEEQIGYFHHIAGSENIFISSIDRNEVIVPALKGIFLSMLGLLLLSVLMAGCLRRFYTAGMLSRSSPSKSAWLPCSTGKPFPAICLRTPTRSLPKSQKASKR